MPATLDDILNSHRTRRPIVMGILNVTPDSFSDGGQFFDPAAAIEQARHMAAEGADVLDIGAESTRPGSRRIPAAEQIARLETILPAVCSLGLCVSIDTTLAAVAEFALDCGASLINDIAAGREDADMFPLAAQRGCGLILMHMQGTPADMQLNPVYRDVVAEVRGFLAERLSAAERAGVARTNCIVDPGIGFGKTIEHNLALLRGVPALRELDRPVLIGASRKRFIGTLTGRSEPGERVFGSIAAACLTYARGATIFRVHDVAATREAMAVCQAIELGQAKI